MIWKKAQDGSWYVGKHLDIDWSGVDWYTEGKTECPHCVAEGHDNSGNNLHVYPVDDDGLPSGGKCYRSGVVVVSLSKALEDEEEKKSQKSGKKFGGRRVANISQKDLKKYSDKKLDEATLSYIEENTSGELLRAYRGLKSEFCEQLGIRWKYNQSTGKVSEMWFPAHNIVDGELITTGYKIRKTPKEFFSKGYVGKINLFAGQTTAVNETLIIVAGEIDLVSAMQMLEPLKKYNRSYTVVTSLLGEDSTAQIIQEQYDWVDKHKKIILCLDNDDAGKAATEKALDILPKDKVYLANLRYKDPNEYLKQKDAPSFLQDAYWNVTPAVEDGIVGSSRLFQAALDSVRNDAGIPLPYFLKDMTPFVPEIPLGTILLFAGATSSGKSTILDEMMWSIILNAPYRTGVLSFEANQGDFGIKVANRVIGTKLQNKPKEERERLLLQYKDEIDRVLIDNHGRDRFLFVDEGFADLEQAKSVILKLIRVHECKIIVIDPLQNLIGSKSLEEQRDFMLFQEECKRLYKTVFINGTHIRKAQNGGSEYKFSESDVEGSGSITKSATLTIAIFRDKTAEDEIDRNTTTIAIFKNRAFSETPMEACKIFYRKSCHRLYPYSVAEENNFFQDDVMGQIYEDDLGFKLADDFDIDEIPDITEMQEYQHEEEVA